MLTCRKRPLDPKQSTQFVCTHQPHSATLLSQTYVNRSPWRMASAHISRSLSHPPSPGMICHSIHETCSPILSVEKQLLEMSEESSKHKEPTQSSPKSDVAYIIIKIHFYRVFSSTPIATTREDSVVYVFRKMMYGRDYPWELVSAVCE